MPASTSPLPGDAEARRAAFVGPGFAVGRDDVAGDTFDQDDGSVELGRAQAAADRIALDLIFVAVEQRRELAGSGAAGRASPTAHAAAAAARLCSSAASSASARIGASKASAICLHTSPFAMPGPATIASTLPACFAIA